MPNFILLKKILEKVGLLRKVITKNDTFHYDTVQEGFCGCKVVVGRFYVTNLY